MDPNASLAQRHLITRVLALVAVAALILGAIVVLRPFFAAGLFAIVFVLATWPLFESLRRRLGLSNAWAALVITLGVLVLVVLPFAWLVQSLVELGPGWVTQTKAFFANGVPAPPAWVARVPLLGAPLETYWRDVAADPGALRALVLRMADVSRAPLVAAAGVVGEGLLQLLLATFLAFFLYRDGEAIVASLRAGLARLAGALSDEMLSISQATIQSVVLGLVGTAAAQGAIATVGFLIAGVPSAFLLGGLTALLSILPGGTVVVWLGATVWLLSEQQVGWAIFMAAWGVGLISSVDNVLRPLLMSRGGHLNFLLVFVGVIGGAIAFGFVGIFIGPTLLALALALWKVWSAPPSPAAMPAEGSPPDEPAATPPTEPAVSSQDRV
jgi:predicted PurR-regulated permease PerM